MKKMSDYKGEEAIELWADLLEPLSEIFTDTELKGLIASAKSKVEVAKIILKSHSDSAVKILLRIDDTPIDGLNLAIRLVELINELGSNKDIASFFGFAEQAKTESESSGSVMENTEVAEN